MALPEQILIYGFTAISIFITIKTIKTAIVELVRFLKFIWDKLTKTSRMIRGKPTEPSESSLGRLFEKSKSTLLPFISRNYYKQKRHTRMVGIGYLFVFLFGVFLILSFFWAFLTADLNNVVENSPYLIGSIKSIITSYQTISKTLSFLFIFGFIVEVINSLRSIFSN